MHGPFKSVVAGAWVEVFDGSNGGRVAIAGTDGYFRFDDLKASSAFWIEFSSPGYQTARFQVVELRSNVLYVRPEAGIQRSDSRRADACFGTL